MHPPKILWTLWTQGWENAPPLVRSSLETMRRHNPDWDVRALSQHDVEKYVDVTAICAVAASPSFSPTQYSEIVRLALLQQYGGVWADGTVYFMRPLADWLPGHMPEGFFAFDRPGPDRMISSWFLAATPDHPLVNSWIDFARGYWQGRQAHDDYFWLHHRFGDGYAADPDFRRVWDLTPKISADGPHFFWPYEESLFRPLTAETEARITAGRDPLFKLTHKVDDGLATPGSVYDYLCRASRT